MRIFLTGGAGFIGSHTASHLLAHGLDVRIFDDLSSGSLENLRRLEEREQFVRGDVLNADQLRRAMRGCDAVLHLAAVVPTQVPGDPAARTLAVNTTGTVNVLEAARAVGIRRVVLGSSAAVYGTAPDPASPDAAPWPANSPYARQKWLGEVYADTYARHHDLSPICLRYFHVYGPRQAPQSPYSGTLSRYIDATLAQRPLALSGGCPPARDYVYVQDVAIANRLALLASDDAAGGIIDIGSGRLVTDHEAYERILAQIGEHVPGTPPQPRRPDIRQPSTADLPRARALLGYAPRVELDEGLARTIAWARQRPTVERRQVMIGTIETSRRMRHA